MAVHGFLPPAEHVLIVPLRIKRNGRWLETMRLNSLGRLPNPSTLKQVDNLYAGNILCYTSDYVAKKLTSLLSFQRSSNCFIDPVSRILSSVSSTLLVRIFRGYISSLDKPEGVQRLFMLVVG